MRDTTVGQFRWETKTDTWTWSAGCYAVHGYAPSAVLPTTAAVLKHKLDDCRDRAATILDEARTRPVTYSNYHRIVDVNGRVRTVLTVGSSALSPAGELVSTGYIADLTVQERAAGTAAVAAASESRAPINQALGAVMTVFGINETAGLALLVWYSQSNNIKLAVLCRRLMKLLSHEGPVTGVLQLTRLLDRAAAMDGTVGPRP